jgi:hypothetical protein
MESPIRETTPGKMAILRFATLNGVQVRYGPLTKRPVRHQLEG